MSRLSLSFWLSTFRAVVAVAECGGLVVDSADDSNALVNATSLCPTFVRRFPSPQDSSQVAPDRRVVVSCGTYRNLTFALLARSSFPQLVDSTEGQSRSHETSQLLCFALFGLTRKLGLGEGSETKGV